MVRAKFTVETIATFRSVGGAELNEISMYPITDKSTPENEQFNKYTPSGRLKMMVDNPAVLAEMQPGKTFYVDFTPAE